MVIWSPEPRAQVDAGITFYEAGHQVNHLVEPLRVQLEELLDRLK